MSFETSRLRRRRISNRAGPVSAGRSLDSRVGSRKSPVELQIEHPVLAFPERLWSPSSSMKFGSPVDAQKHPRHDQNPRRRSWPHGCCLKPCCATQMQLLKWSAVPAVVLFVAATLAIAGWLDSTWVSVLFTFSSLAALFRWRRATYRLEGSIQNVDHDRLNSEGQRIFKTIFVVTFTSSILLMMGALLVPAAGTAAGGALTINVMVWCPSSNSVQ